MSDQARGIRREMGPLGFKYVGLNGKVIRNAAELKRIRSLAVPPAWTDVWICADPRGHLQATGRDARGRKQYRYHPDWRACRDENKYDRMQSFAAALADIRKRTRIRPRPAGAPAGEGAGDRGAVAREEPDPRGQRRVRQGEPVFRPDDAPQQSRGRQGLDTEVRVPREERRPPQRRRQRPPARAHRQAVPRPARARNCFSTSTTMARTRT